MSKMEKKGAFAINEVVVITANGSEINITNQWMVIELFEDLFAHNLSGTILVGDTHNFLKNGPIVGQEDVRISITTQGINGENNSVDKWFRIYKIAERIVTPNGRVQGYKLHLISSDEIINSQTKCNYAFSDMTVENMVSEICYKHFPQTPLRMANIPSKNKHTFVLPTREPFHCIQWLLKRGVNSQNTADCHYIFYQDIDGYKVDTIPNLIKQPVVFNGKYEYKIPNMIGGVGTFRNPHERLNVPEKVVFNRDIDKLKEVKNGMIASSIRVYDLTTKTYTTNSFNYIEHFNKLYKDQQKINPLFTETPNDNSQERIGTIIHYHPKSSGSIGEVTLEEINEQAFSNKSNNDFYEEWVLPRDSLEQQIESSSIVLKGLAGNSTRRVGQMVEFHFPSPEPNRGEDKMDEYVTGKYLITSIRHLISKQDYTMNMEISRSFLPTKLPAGVK